jgi:hypothetical protein
LSSSKFDLHATVGSELHPLGPTARKDRQSRTTATRIQRRSSTVTTASLDRWSIARYADTDWVPWGHDVAREKVLGNADGCIIAPGEAEAGYQGTPHKNTYTELLYPVSGRLRTQGHELTGGDCCAATAGSTEDEFEALEPSTYLSIFRI